MPAVVGPASFLLLNAALVGPRVHLAGVLGYAIGQQCRILLLLLLNDCQRVRRVQLFLFLLAAAGCYLASHRLTVEHVDDLYFIHVVARLLSGRLGAIHLV